MPKKPGNTESGRLRVWLRENLTTWMTVRQIKERSGYSESVVRYTLDVLVYNNIIVKKVRPGEGNIFISARELNK